MVKWRSMLLGGAISAACIVLLLRSIDVAKTGESFAQADPWWIGLALLTVAVALWMRCWKWQLLFRPDDRVSLWGATSASLVGYMFNTVLPGRVGELARASLVAQTDDVSTARAIGTIFVEKILDILMLLLLLGGLTLAVPLPGWVTAAGVSASTTFGLAAVVFFALSGLREPVVRWTERRVDPLPVAQRVRPSHWADMLLGAARGLGRPRLLSLQLALTVVLWTCAVLTCVTTLRAFHVDVPWTAAVLVIVTTNLGMTVPSAPGYIGVYEAITVLTLQLFGVDAARGLSVALALHVLGLGTFAVAGAVILLHGLSRQRYTLSGVFQRAAPKPQRPSAAPPAHAAAPAQPAQAG